MNLPTQHQLREAKRLGRYQLERESMFYLHRRKSGDLKKPTVTLKLGTVVEVEKIYKRGEAALLKYVDRSGKIWWSWAHAGRERK